MAHPRFRIAIVAAYLATLLGADLSHRHGPVEPPPECAADCFAPGVHLSGHHSPDLSAHPESCPACLVRVAPALAPEAPSLDTEPAVESFGAFQAPVLDSQAVATPRGRGPPLRSIRSIA